MGQKTRDFGRRRGGDLQDGRGGREGGSGTVGGGNCVM